MTTSSGSRGSNGVPVRTVAVGRYLLVDVLRAQRALIPVVLYLIVLGVLFGGDHTAAPGPWVASVLALYPVAAWVALSVANTEDPDQRAVTTAAAGGPGVVTAAVLGVAIAVDVVLAGVSVALPGLIDPAGFPPAALAAGGLAHLAAASTGTAVGLLCARPLIGRVGWSSAAGALIVLVTAVQPWLPPVGAAARALAGPHPGPAVLVHALLGVALAVVAATISWTACRRR